jgi:hypothetical protein
VRAEALSLDAELKLPVLPPQINSTCHTNGYGDIPPEHFHFIRHFCGASPPQAHPLTHRREKIHA